MASGGSKPPGGRVLYCGRPTRMPLRPSSASGGQRPTRRGGRPYPPPMACKRSLSPLPPPPTNPTRSAPLCARYQRRWSEARARGGEVAGAPRPRQWAHGTAGGGGAAGSRSSRGDAVPTARRRWAHNPSSRCHRRLAAPGAKTDRGEHANNRGRAPETHRPPAELPSAGATRRRARRRRGDAVRPRPSSLLPLPPSASHPPSGPRNRTLAGLQITWHHCNRRGPARETGVPPPPPPRRPLLLPLSKGAHPSPRRPRRRRPASWRRRDARPPSRVPHDHTSAPPPPRRRLVATPPAHPPTRRRVRGRLQSGQRPRFGHLRGLPAARGSGVRGLPAARGNCGGVGRWPMGCRHTHPPPPAGVHLVGGRDFDPGRQSGSRQVGVHAPRPTRWRRRPPRAGPVGPR